MSGNTKPVITVDEMKARAAACQTSIEAIQTRLQDGVSAGPAAAQAARLVAFAFAKQAYTMLENVNGSVQYLSAPARTPSPEGEGKAPLDKVMDIAEQIGEKSEQDITAALVEVAQEVLEAMMEQFNVEKEAIPTFLYETNAYILPVIEDMVAAATAKLDEADALTAATPAA
jgi:hypothetical protein